MLFSKKVAISAQEIPLKSGISDSHPFHEK